MTKTEFSDYLLDDTLLKSIGILQFESPTEVQRQVIPALLQHKDIIVKSQTGSGKTAAFAIPICQMVDWDENKPQALVVAPTRELAIQVKEDIFNLGRFKRLKVAAIFGKSPFGLQEKELKQKTHIVVGTPGRLMDHLERGTFDPSHIKYLVIDEADELLNMGFIEQIETIIKELPKDRVTVLLSATMPRDIEALCNQATKDPLYIEVEEHNPAADRISQQGYTVHPKDKMELLRDILIVENPDSCLIFCNTKQKANELATQLNKHRIACEKIHGGMEQVDRLRVMDDFKRGCFRYLVATDVAARGIDIDNITLIINYDLPLDGETYVHRIGRTGRVENTGKAISFITPYENKFLSAVEQYTGKEIDLKERPNKETVDQHKQEFVKKTNAAPETKKTKGDALNRDILKLHINAGKKTKMRATDIVGTLCNIKGMTAQDIGIIHIADVSTFVEILNKKGEMVFTELQHTPIKGRLRRVSKVDIDV